MRTSVLRPLVLCSIAVSCAVASTTAARADSHADLRAALEKTFLHQSFHMQMKSATQTMDGDVSADGRERVTNGRMQMVLIGNAMYIKHGGSWQKIDTGGGSLSPIEMIRRSMANGADFTSTDRGMRVEDGAMTHAYRATNRKTGNVDTVYLDGQGRIVRVDTGTAGGFIRFSHFGEPTNITAPV